MISIGSMMSLNYSYSLDDNDDDMEVTPSPHMRLKRKLSSGNIKTPPGTSTSPVFNIHINVCCELKLDTLIEWTYSCTYNTLTCMIEMNCWKSTFMCVKQMLHTNIFILQLPLPCPFFCKHVNMITYYINTNEIPGKHDTVSSHVKITCYIHAWKHHHCYGYIINCTFHSRKLLKWNDLVFHCCLYNKIHMAAWRYKISLLVLKNISLILCAHS